MVLYGHEVRVLDIKFDMVFKRKIYKRHSHNQFQSNPSDLLKKCLVVFWLRSQQLQTHIGTPRTPTITTRTMTRTPTPTPQPPTGLPSGPLRPLKRFCQYNSPYVLHRLTKPRCWRPQQSPKLWPVSNRSNKIITTILRPKPPGPRGLIRVEKRRLDLHDVRKIIIDRLWILLCLKI